uniref:Uncharacterized protein n=1 Tax=Rhizophora mucronata TaxID=61149 RepID=A0A2P2J8L7_RHIMU
MGSVEEQTPLLEDGLLQQNDSNGLYTGDGSVDFHGNPVLKQKTGNWRACPFILGTECCERLAYYGIATNLVTYLTTKLHEGNVSAARNVSTWAGTCYLAPLIGAILADAYWGRYWTIAAFSTIYFIVFTSNLYLHFLTRLQTDHSFQFLFQAALFILGSISHMELNFLANFFST